MDYNKMTQEEKKDFKINIMNILKKTPGYSFNGYYYLSLATDALKNYKKNKNDYDSIEPKGKFFNKESELRNEITKNYLVVITFATMFLETAIWNYGFKKKSKSFIEQYDKFGLERKWRSYPKLIVGKEISENSKAIKLLKKLVKERNAIVHAKSRPIPESFEELLCDMGKEQNHEISAEEAIECIAECFNELQTIDSDWWIFKELKGNALIGRILLPGFDWEKKRTFNQS